LSVYYVCGLLLWFITGCTEYSITDAEYPIDPTRLSQEALAEVPDHQVRRAYAKNRSPRLQAELERRETFTALEWQAIKGRKVLMGIGEMALMTTLPGIKCMHTLRSKGVVTREWYCERLAAIKVRTENGKVVWFR
jgi:hypothetical protein